MKLNTIIRLPDGREGTICWNHLDGSGGVWGRHHFEMPEGGFGDNLPAPEFMLREKSVEPLLRKQHWRGPEYSHRPDLECVGTEYEVVREGGLENE